MVFVTNLFLNDTPTVTSAADFNVIFSTISQVVTHTIGIAVIGTVTLKV